MGQDAAEYDFRDFRWAKLERLRRGARPAVNMARDEALLEYNVGEETAAPSEVSSPRLDAIDVNNAWRQPSATTPSVSSVPSNTIEMSESQSIGGVDMAQNEQPWGFTQSEDRNQIFPMDWSWLLGESSHPGFQTGDPTVFWNQLQQM